MTRDELILLGRVRIATPCDQSWWLMRGDDRVRHCRACTRDVYDLSRIDAIDARALLNRREGRPCVRLWVRRDGRVVTRNCAEPGRRSMRVLLAVFAIWVVAWLVAFVLRRPEKPALDDAVHVAKGHRELKGFAADNNSY
jgi:hypothetical protein